MEEYQRDISPITKIQTIVYCKYKIQVDKIYIGENKADISIILCDEGQINLKQFFYTIAGDEYVAWTSDEYIKTYVKNKLKNELF
jgi:hypothetical protein